ncbi:unnamed protein product, partial [Dracunculus medinensis]|uniref:Cytochrome c oxidase subunit n=1 Tax=Dracunculus medinensis TaxID=318479 RepID=A0A0N4UA41_DRAME
FIYFASSNERISKNFIFFIYILYAKTFWKKVFFFCAIPSMLLTAYGAKKIHDKEGHFDQSKYVEYPYLNVRNKPFPWGDGNHSLFHNKKTQFTPGIGFEEKDH